LKKLLFVDLDDTLFHTLPKCRPNATLRPVAFLKDGAPISWASTQQLALLADMMLTMQVIPATARNHDAFLRVDLPFSDYAIIDYGGAILRPDGTPDQEWQEKMQAPMQAALPGLQQAQQVMDQYASRNGWAAKSRLISDFGTPFYLMIKDPNGDAERLAQMENDCLRPWLQAQTQGQIQGQTQGQPQAGLDYFIHRNGNNLALLPRTLNKAHAVAFLRQRFEAEHGPLLALGMGDSHSDAAFMAACDYAIIPQHSQLAALTLAPLAADILSASAGSEAGTSPGTLPATPTAQEQP
jgi:hydroxymethylpyrimidine pyrophosphatase-like HAD family hydrolase